MRGVWSGGWGHSHRTIESETELLFSARRGAELTWDSVSSSYRPCPLVPSQSWADAFRSSPDLTGVVAVYEDLRRKGLEFPMTDLDMLSPIHTPQRVRRLTGSAVVSRGRLRPTSCQPLTLALTDRPHSLTQLFAL